MNTKTAQEIGKLLNTKYIRKSKGQFMYWKSYYYGFSITADKLSEHVMASIPNAIITGSGNHWHEFVGNAKSGTAKDSYLWVTFTIKD